MKTETLVVLLRAALRDIQSRSSQTNFYDPQKKQSFEIQSTLDLIDEHHPECTAYKLCLGPLEAV